MPHPIEPSTLRILKPIGETVGTGFLVSKHLAVTCAHVVKTLGAGAGNTIDIRFTGKSAATTARVLPEYWRPDDSTDIAILQVDEVPAGVFPLRMGRASESRLKNNLYAFGYAIAADEQGIGGLGTFITLKQEGNFIQFRMHEANHGHSGAPIYDDRRGVVVGMVKKGHTGAGRNAETTFAIPTETIWQVCPQLKPPTPVLPRRNPIVEGINLLPYDYDQRIQNFLTEYLGTETHPVPFGGRDDALKMLNAWMADTTPYLLLAAPAGRGKSALLVRWLDRLKEREDLALTFVPISIRFGTNIERVFYAALAARLAFLHGDDVPASPETSTAVYRGLVSDYLSKPLANGRTLLVVLDGLDEAADWQAGADFMPSELPAGVRVVVSARFLAGDADSVQWLRRLNWERNGLASAPSLTPLDQEGVRDVLFKMGCPLDELSRKVDIVAELYRLSAGDPLLIGLYVGDLWAKGDEVTRLQPEDLADIQPGYKGYFDRWWDDQKKLWGKDKPWFEKHVRAVRNLLAGALGPLFRDDFQALDPELESDYISDALDVLQRFIIGDNQSQGYTFNHPKLGQYFWEALTVTEQTKVEERFLAWGEQTLQEFIDGKRDPKKKAHVPVYVVRNYGAHLTRANQPIEKWLPLIHQQQWAQAWFTVEGAYGGYSQDVQRVWGQCRVLDRQAIEKMDKAPYIGQQIRCGLIEASLHSLAGQFPSTLIPTLVWQGVWTWQQTWVFIRQMPNSSKQFDVIIDILPKLESDQLSQALGAARAIQDDVYRARALSALSIIMPDVARESLEAALSITNEQYRAHVLSDLVWQLPKSMLGAVLEATGRFKIDNRARILRNLAQSMQDEELGSLLEMVLAIKHKYWRAYILSALIQRLPELADEALELALDIKHEWGSAPSAPSTYLLSELAKHIPQEVLGQILNSARAIQDEYDRALVLNQLVKRMPEIAPEVMETVRAIKDESARIELLSQMAQCAPEIVPELVEVVRAVKDESKRIELLSQITQCAPEIVPELVEAVRAMKDERERTEALKKLAQCLPEEALGQVLEMVRVVDDEESRAKVLEDLIQRMPIEKLELLLEEVRTTQVKNKKYIAYLLCCVAQRMPEVAPDALGALENMRTIQDRWERAIMLGQIAKRVFPEAAREAIEAALEIKEEYEEHCIEVLKELAQHFPKQALEQVLKAVMMIQNGGTPPNFSRFSQGTRILTLRRSFRIADVLGELAQRVPEESLVQLLEVVRAIQNDEERAYLLSKMTRRMPEILPEVLNEVLEIPAPLYLAYTSLFEPRLKIFETMPDSSFLDHSHPLITLARCVPDKDLRLLLEASWTIQDERKRAIVLRELALRMPKGELKLVLEAAWAIQDEMFRTYVFEGLAQRMPKGEFGLMLKAVRAIKDSGYRVHLLSLLAQRTPDVVPEVLETARAMEYNVYILSVLAQRIPDLIPDALESSLVLEERERVKVFIELAQQIPEEALGQVLEATRTIQDEPQRVKVLKELAYRMKEGELRLLLKEVKKIECEYARANMLKELSQRMPIEELSLLLKAADEMIFEICRVSVWSTLVQRMPAIVPNVLKAVRAIQNENDRAEVLGELAQRLPEDVLEQLLEIIHSLKLKHLRANILCDLAMRLPKVSGEALEVSAMITNDIDRAKTLSLLAQSLTAHNSKHYYLSEETTLGSLSIRNRVALFSDISSLLSVFVYLGTEDTPREIYEAVRDVTAWWP